MLDVVQSIHSKGFLFKLEEEEEKEVKEEDDEEKDEEEEEEEIIVTAFRSPRSSSF